jgi:hypothetical protein
MISPGIPADLTRGDELLLAPIRSRRFGFAKGTWMPTFALRHVRDVLRLKSAGIPPQIADDRSVAAIASKAPIVNADDGQTISSKRGPSSYDSKQPFALDSQPTRYKREIRMPAGMVLIPPLENRKLDRKHHQI